MLMWSSVLAREVGPQEQISRPDQVQVWKKEGRVHQPARVWSGPGTSTAKVGWWGVGGGKGCARGAGEPLFQSPGPPPSPPPKTIPHDPLIIWTQKSPSGDPFPSHCSSSDGPLYGGEPLSETPPAPRAAGGTRDCPFPTAGASAALGPAKGCASAPA